MKSSRAIFLDRDGVLNAALIKEGKPYSPRQLQDFKILPEVKTCLLQLKKHDFFLCVVTNQPDIARGLMDYETLEAMHKLLATQLPIDVTYVCVHDDKDNCACRKPKPGLLLQAANEYNLNLAESFLIGDRWKDIAAASAVGTKGIWLDQGYQENFPDNCHPNFRATSLKQAVEWILTNKG